MASVSLLLCINQNVYDKIHPEELGKCDFLLSSLCGAGRHQNKMEMVAW